MTRFCWRSSRGRTPAWTRRNAFDRCSRLAPRGGPASRSEATTTSAKRLPMIPVNEPLLTARDLEYVADCVKTGWVSSAGSYLTRFEQDWASYCGRKYGIAVANGTVALELAARCLGLGPGDEVILPTFTIISCALAVVQNGATPVLVDA